MLDEVMETLFNSQTLFLSLGVFVLTYFVRKIVETVWPKVRNSVYWRELALPLGPVANGALLAVLMKTWVFPEVVGASIVAKLLYGGVCGFFSGYLYNRIRSFLKAKADAQGGQAAAAVAALPVMGPDSLPPAAESLPPAAEPAVEEVDPETKNTDPYLKKPKG